MKSEYFIFVFIQNSLTYQTKISDVFLVFSTPALTPVPASHHFEPGMTHMTFFLGATAKPGIAGPKNVPQNAITGDITAIFTVLTQSVTVAVRAGFLRERDSFRTVPIDFH